jgi:ornithine carbamoyltransferase
VKKKALKMKRDLLTLSDLSSGEITGILRRAVELKAGKDAGKCPLIGRSIGLLFEKVRELGFLSKSEFINSARSQFT